MDTFKKWEGMGFLEGSSYQHKLADTLEITATRMLEAMENDTLINEDLTSTMIFPVVVRLHRREMFLTALEIRILIKKFDKEVGSIRGISFPSYMDVEAEFCCTFCENYKG